MVRHRLASLLAIMGAYEKSVHVYETLLEEAQIK